MRIAIIILGVVLFIIGPIAKINHLEGGNNYMIASGMGLIMITAMAFIKKKENQD